MAMIINWLGMSCCKIQTKEATIIINPFSDKCGLKMPKLKADITLVSNKEHYLTNNSERLSGESFLINSPGEYEIKQIYISGLSAGQGDQTKEVIYYLENEDITIGHLGLLNHSLSNDQLETMEGVDILLLPISTLNAERRSKIISQIEPRVIIPMLYKIPQSKEKLDDLQVFLKEMGVKEAEKMDKYKVAKKELPQEETKIIILNPTK